MKTTKQKESGFSVMATSPLSRREEELFNLLRETLPNHIILTQVDIKRVLDFKSGDRQKYMKVIGRLSLDFVILDRNFKPVACYELDDSTHHNSTAKYNDSAKRVLLKKAGISLFHSEKIPTADKIREAIDIIYDHKESKPT